MRLETAVMNKIIENYVQHSQMFIVKWNLDKQSSDFILNRRMNL
jgi:hypothetical protein